MRPLHKTIFHLFWLLANMQIISNFTADYLIKEYLACLSLCEEANFVLIIKTETGIPIMNEPYHKDEAAEVGERLHLVTFKLLGEEFGLPILDVREIIRMTDITPVPQAPGFVEGVINLRGQILPVVDLRTRFGLDQKDADAQTRIVVVELRSTVIGLIVDEVSEVLRIPASTIAPPPGIVAGSIGAEYIKGIGHYDEKMIILIDMRKVFSEEEIQGLEGMER